MGREKRTLLTGGTGPKERHRKSQYDPKAPVPEGFVAKPTAPRTKHHSYFEFVDNKEKKKKLEFQITSKRSPPPGFEFVPIGNPILTTECKELSREKDAMIFIVSNAKALASNNLAHQVHRIGHHIRETIVDEARARIGQVYDPEMVLPHPCDVPEPIPESQEAYNAQVDGAIRDLFPRIPNTDRQLIIERAFRKGTTIGRGEKPVGLSQDITLARRVQLAVLAHIRHTHTRYDNLLKETTWQNARKVVEALCLDTLVKWRGDEETGRDQLDEILREVVVISDSEDDDSEDETDETSPEDIGPMPTTAIPVGSQVPGQMDVNNRRTPKTTHHLSGPSTPVRPNAKVTKNKGKRSAGRKAQRGFKRYHAWQEAIRRFREERDEHPQPTAPDSPKQGPHQRFVSLDAAPYMAPGSYAPQVRAAPDRAGPAPTENGYVSHPSTHYGQPQMDSAPTSHPLRPQQPIYEQVKPPVSRPSPRISSHRAVSPVGGRLQDMLVPSIEPVSPNVMQPSFVRAVPPRVQYPVDHPSSYPRFPRPPSPSNDVVMTDQFVSERMVPAGRFDDNRTQFSTMPRDQMYAPSRDGFPISTTVRSDGRSYAYDRPPGMASPRRSYADVPRPDDRANPIIMEDRGGFYERVHPHPDGGHTKPAGAEIIEIRRPVQEIQRRQDPHRVASWEERPRILAENQGNARVLPIFGSRTLPTEVRSQAVVVDPFGFHRQSPNHVAYERFEGRGSRPTYYSAPVHESMPVYREGMAPLYQSYQVRRNEQTTPYAPNHQPPHRQYQDDRPLVDNRQPRRGFPLHPRQPENVIVLE